MTTPGRRAARAWLTSVAALALLAAVSVPYADFVRQRQAPAALVFLLLVLYGTVTGGRALGLTLAVVGSLVLNYYFQLPYNDWGVHDPADWLVVVTYGVTVYVASGLVLRARGEAAAARRRSEEVQRLADLGASSLSAGRADDALQAIAAVIARTLRLDACEVWDVSDDGTVHRAAAADAGGHPLPPARDDAALLDRVRHGAARPLDDDPAGRTRRLRALLAAEPSDVLVPLSAHHRVVGALRVVRADGLALDDSGHTFLEALSYYAALGVERVRLVAEAERAEALREAARLKDFLLASVSHDLRTPLTTIKALAHERARDGDPTALRIEEQADRLTRIVRDVLDLSRVRAGGLPLALELNTAEDVVGAALRQTAGALRDRRVEVRLPDDGGFLAGRFDFVATLRILGNLLENAAKYAPAHEPIVVGVATDDDGRWLAFSVLDRGPGVAEAERERIFLPFHRAGDAPDVGGAGLGLAVARALAEAQGGTLALAPRPGGGSAFTFRVQALDVAAVVG